MQIKNYIISLLYPLLLVLLVSTSVSVAQAAAQEGENNPISENNVVGSSLFESLQREDVLNLTIAGDFTAIIDGEGKAKYQNATFAFEDQEGVAVEWDIEVRQRGKSRRRYCDFPPLKLRFNKEQLAAQGLQKFHTLKLVTHCLDDFATAKEAVLREYLAYKIYNEVTDYSYRVQLVRITYRDQSGKFKKVKRYGFLIENNHEMAARLDGEISDVLNVAPENRHAQIEAQAALFQYMIGNQDWDLRFVRNLKYVKVRKSDQFLIVPYDFDFSGFVSAPYAKPNPDFGLVSVRDRIYLGNPQDTTAIKSALVSLNAKKERIYQTIYRFKKLDREVRYELVDYLETFFQSASYDDIFGQSPLEVSERIVPVNSGRDD